MNSVKNFFHPNIFKCQLCLRLISTIENNKNGNANAGSILCDNICNWLISCSICRKYILDFQLEIKEKQNGNVVRTLIWIRPVCRHESSKNLNSQPRDHYGIEYLNSIVSSKIILWIITSVDRRRCKGKRVSTSEYGSFKPSHESSKCSFTLPDNFVEFVDWEYWITLNKTWIIYSIDGYFTNHRDIKFA